MKMFRHGSLLPASLLGAALLLPGAGSAAIPLAGEALEIHGRFHMSLDLADTDRPGEGTDLNLSSNTSMIGFRGRHVLDPQATLLWQLEQGFRIDSASGSLATRNTFLGVENPQYGALLAGYHDTPFKDVGSRWALMNFTVADRRMILGAGARVNNVMNTRARNSLLYINRIDNLEVRVMYATDTVDAVPAGPDDNDNRLISTAAWYTLGPLQLSAAYERWSNLIGGQAPDQQGRSTGLRLAATHQVGAQGRVGVLFESISTAAGVLNDLDRNAYGLNGSYRLGVYTLDAQFLMADDHSGVSDSGAWNIGLGLSQQINRQTSIYGAFSMTSNDSNATYKGVDGGHGDHVPTVDGGTPYAFSVGALFRF